MTLTTMDAIVVAYDTSLFPANVPEAVAITDDKIIAGIAKTLFSQL